MIYIYMKDPFPSKHGSMHACQLSSVVAFRCVRQEEVGSGWGFQHARSACPGSLIPLN